ncbi:MAG: pyrroline-5-carboxylate reductase [Patescibacteria group bacterium]
MLKTAIIGAGNMGGAFYHGLRQSVDEQNVHLCDHSEAKLSIAPAEYRFTDVLEATKDAECVVLAIKPQAFAKLMSDVGQAWSEKLLVSIMAGIPLSRLEKLTGSSRIVRSMPNLGAKIRRSVTGWCASKGISQEDREHVERLFQSIGLSIELDAEEKIDGFTAIAGSGPAYVFGLAELLTDAAKKLGLSDEDSSRFASEVIVAGSRLLEEGTMTAPEWRKAVTSKGGVTEAAIKVFSEKKLSEIFHEALGAGMLRSRSLSSEHE